MPRPDFTTPKDIIQKMIRVDHAGEYGARRIYEGQLSLPLNQEATNTIQHMLQQEELHLSYFSQLLLERKVRPTILIPLWHVIGYILGKGSVMIGSKAAMLVTQSIEEVIEQHYQHQIDYLESHNIEKELLSRIKQFQLEEVEHRDTALVFGSNEVACGSMISRVIKYMCNVAIRLSKVI